MGLERLFEEGLLKKIPPSSERADKSLQTADKYLREAGTTLSAGAHMSAILAAYSCMFHSARAVLFRDGVGERSHVAVYEYLKEKHKALGAEQANLFNLYRSLRHSVAYGVETEVSEEDAKEAVRSAEEFLKKVKAYLQSPNLNP